MSRYATDRNLLVGILGLQMGLINESQLIAAMKSWTFQKESSIEAILVEQDALSSERREFLVGLVEQYLALSGNDPAEGLAQLSSFAPVKEHLCKLEDDDISLAATLADERRRERKVTDGQLSDETLTMPVRPERAGERFRVLRPHAQGALGQVSIAEDIELHREVALKEIQPRYEKDPQSRNRFLIEAEVTGRLEHPGIVPVYSLGRTESGSPFYVMRFIKGDSLKEAIVQLYRSDPPLTGDSYRMELRNLVRRLIDVCNAIEYAHSRGVLHRDLKPGNIMLGRYGETLVVDWGLAKTKSMSQVSLETDESVFVPQSGDSSSQTRMGSIVGTLAYMSPEQAEGRLEALGPTSDVYSLGATLYCMLTGESPLKQIPRDEILARVRAGQIPRPRVTNPQAPAALDAICVKAMALRQADRYPSANTLARELELWLADEPVSAYHEPYLDRIARFGKKHKAWVTAALAIVTTAAVALLILNMLIQSQNQALEVARDHANEQRDLADHERKLAEDSKALAIQEKQRAEANLESARRLSILLLTTAEEKLTTPAIDGRLIQNLRKTLTEASYENFSKIFEQNPSDLNVANEFAQVMRISSNLKRLERDFQSADDRIQRSLDLQLLTPSNQRTIEQKDYLAETYREVGTLQKGQGKLSEAESAFDNALAIIEQLIESNPTNPLYRRTKATIELEQIGLFDELENLELALAKARASSESFESLRQSDAAISNDAFLFLFAQARILRLLHRLGHGEAAESFAKSAIETGREIHLKRPEDANVTLPYARILYWSAEGLVDNQGSYEDATVQLKESIALLDGLVDTTPRAGYIYGLGEALRIQATLLRKQNQFAEANAAISRSVKWLQDLVTASNKADNLDLLAKSLLESGLIQHASGDTTSAVATLTKAVEIQTEACVLTPKSKSMRGTLARIEQELERLRSEMRDANPQ